MMKKISEAVGNISTQHIEEAADYVVKRKNHTPMWSKIGLIAACFAVVTVLGIGIFQSGLFGNKTEIAVLDNGTEIVFVKSKTAVQSPELAFNVTTRQLTGEELAVLFPNLPVTVSAVFGDNEKLLGFEGRIRNAKMVITTTDIPLLDTVIDGIEEESAVNGTSVAAGYFETDRNSIGEQNVIYYATFKLGDSTVYLENAGKKAESENIKNDLAVIIQEIINNGALDLSTVNGHNSADAAVQKK